MKYISLILFMLIFFVSGSENTTAKNQFKPEEYSKYLPDKISNVGIINIANFKVSFTKPITKKHYVQQIKITYSYTSNKVYILMFGTSCGGLWYN